MRSKVKFIDLFAGTGGMRLALEQVASAIGFESECVFSSEIDPDACETYRLNFKEISSGDIRQSSGEIPPFDFLLAGFPCQPFSYAGKRMGFGDTRGTLFFEIETILKAHKPKGFLLENVRGLTTHDGGKTLKTIIHSLNELGYATKYILCNSSNFGVPQNRVRVYILGALGKQVNLSIESDLGASDSHTFKNRTSQVHLFSNKIPHKMVQDILEDEVEEKYLCSDEFTKMLSDAVSGDFEKLHGVRLIDYRGGNSLHSWDLGIKGKCSKKERSFMNALISNRRKKIFGTEQDGKMLTKEQIRTFFSDPDIDQIILSLLKKRYLKKIGEKYNPVCGNMSFEVFKFLDPKSISITLTTADSHKLGVVQNNRPRRITPRECARLQGFPDNFILHPNDIATYRQMGNAVSVPVVKEILEDFFKLNSSLIIERSPVRNDCEDMPQREKMLVSA
jgi:DNA (cytosine-5)-methyltransferase 1